MLVIERLRRPDAANDRGSALVTVLGIALIGFVVVAVVATASMFVVRSNADNRENVLAFVAAESGRDAVVAELTADPSSCSAEVSSPAGSVPEYTVTVFHSNAALAPSGSAEATAGCPSGASTFLVLRSTGTSTATGRTSTVEAVYEYSRGTVAGEGADMVFFGNTTFSNQVLSHTLTEDLLSIVIPTGGFTCMAPVPANIVVQGDFVTLGNCTIEGSVVAGGNLDISNGPDTILGNVSAAGTGTAVIRGTIGGDVHTGGGIGFGWENKTIGGTVTADGTVSLGSARLQGLLSVPATQTLNMQSGQAQGGIARPPAVTPPETPVFEQWFDYSFSPSDWPGFAVRTLSNSGSGPLTCNHYNSWPSTGWYDLAALTVPTVIDARACSNLSANAGMQPTVDISTDIVFLARSFDLTRLTLNNSGGDPRVWWVVEDTTANGFPTCSGGAGNIAINHTVMGDGITAMAYTPCVVSVHGSSRWTGSFYGGSFNYGGGLSFFGSSIVLPGQDPVSVPGGGGVSPGEAILGALVRQSEVP